MIKEMMKEIGRIIDNNKGKSLGAILGFLIGVMILTIGFFKTLFLFISIGIGCFLGSKSYNIHDIKDWLERNLPPGGIR